MGLGGVIYEGARRGSPRKCLTTAHWLIKILTTFGVVSGPGATEPKETATMEDRPYRLDVKLPAGIEFHAEGPESSVRSDFEMFLAAIRATAQAPAPPDAVAGGAQDARASTERPGDTAQPDSALLERVFDNSGGTVSLRLLPPDSSTRAADAAMLLLYGYLRLSGVQDVPVMSLNSSLRRSGISVDRVDRILSTHDQYYMKGGTRSGGRYTLNNPGIAYAERLLSGMFR
jgi:hypothetical protein